MRVLAVSQPKQARAAAPWRPTGYGVKIRRFPAVLVAAARRVRFLSSTHPNGGGPESPPNVPEQARGGTPRTALEISFSLASGASVQAVITSQACASLTRHCTESNRHGREVGGILVGYRYERANSLGHGLYFAVLTDLIPVHPADSSSAHVCFDEETWLDIERRMAATYLPEGKCRLGWYHTHPTQGIFFSGQDRELHSVFRHPAQFALVVDPRNAEAGLFFWADCERGALGGPVRFWLDSRAANREASSQRTGAIRFGSQRKRLELEKMGSVYGLILLLFLFFVGRNGILQKDLVSLPPAAEQRAPLAAAPGKANTIAAASQPVLAPPPAARVSQSGRNAVHLAVIVGGAAPEFGVTIESRKANAKLTYVLENCAASAGRPKVSTCRILFDRRSEESFFGRVFRWNSLANRDGIRKLQEDLDFGGKLDGRWGGQTRAAWLERALDPPPLNTAHVSIAGGREVTVLFDSGAL